MRHERPEDLVSWLRDLMSRNPAVYQETKIQIAQVSERHVPIVELVIEQGYSIDTVGIELAKEIRSPDAIDMERDRRWWVLTVVDSLKLCKAVAKLIGRLMKS